MILTTIIILILYSQDCFYKLIMCYDGVESAIHAIIGVFSLLLLALSILAYRRTGLKKIIFAAIAFSLFAVQLLLGSFEETFLFGRSSNYGYLIIFYDTCYFSSIFLGNSEEE